MAGVDTNIYNKLTQPPPDPLDMASKAVGLNNSSIENQLLGRNFQAQQIRQQALSNAYDPNTGQFDVNKYYNTVQGTPAAQYLPEDIQAGQAIYGKDVANQGAAQGLLNTQTSTLGEALGAKLNAGGLNGFKDAAGVIHDLIYSGQISPELGGRYLHLMPTDDAKAKSYATNLYLRTVPTAAQPTDMGVDPNTGATVTGTTGEKIARALHGEQPAAPGARPAPAPGYISSLAPGDPDSVTLAKKAAAQQGINLEAEANAAPDRKATIANLQDDLNGIATGPLADKIYRAKAGYNELNDAAGSPLPGWDAAGVAKLDRFRKNSQILANQQFQALNGTGTDAQLQAAINSNPGTYLSAESNRGILAMLQGNQDAIQAKATAWRKYQAAKGVKANFNDFSEDFNNSYSPRAFQIMHMSPADQTAMMKSMNPTERGQVDHALGVAFYRGWITPPAGWKPRPGDMQ